MIVLIDLFFLTFWWTFVKHFRMVNFVENKPAGVRSSHLPPVVGGELWGRRSPQLGGPHTEVSSCQRPA